MLITVEVNHGELEPLNMHVPVTKIIPGIIIVFRDIVNLEILSGSPLKNGSQEKWLFARDCNKIK